MSSDHSDRTSARSVGGEPARITLYAGTSVRMSRSSPSDGSVGSPARPRARTGATPGFASDQATKPSATSAGTIVTLHWT